MPATSPEAIARMRQRDFERRKERRRSDLDFVKRETAARAERRQRQAEDPDYVRRETKARAKRRKNNPNDNRNRERARARAFHDSRPFVGCDGEGIGRVPDHKYVLFRMGSRELYDNDRRLTTAELVAFIVAHPSKNDLLCAFAFDYDASNILRDLPAERQAFLLGRDTRHRTTQDNVFKKGQGGYTYWRPPGQTVTYGIEYVPRNYLRVCIVEQVIVSDPKNPKVTKLRWLPDSDTTRTIFDAFGNFQSSFLAALNDWQIGAEHWEAIKLQKDNRAHFTTITPEIRDYCRIECELLSQLMTAFRAACLATDIRPKTWNGAGKLAAALMYDHDVMRRKDIERKLHVALLKLAHEAYYGGRFEVTRCGLIDQPVNEYDIRSAYPDAMRSLPCLEHGIWHQRTGRQLQRSKGLFVCNVVFRHPKTTFLCGLPFRSQKGKLCWPRAGSGAYWSVEIRSAQRMGAKLEWYGGYEYEKRCDCRPFAWMQQRYEYRKEIDRQHKGKGKPLKLGINAVYGKLAQRIGEPPFANPIWAGMITAFTRAKLNDAILSAGPKNIVMIATDALYSVKRIKSLLIGDGLGQWDYEQHRSLFIVHPGLYWPPKPRTAKWKLKTRGVSVKFLEPAVALFRRKWRAYEKRRKGSPVVPVWMTTFVGLRLANHLNSPKYPPCQWVEREMKLTFECASQDKRGLPRRWYRRSVIMDALDGDPWMRSRTYKYRQLSDMHSAIEQEAMWIEAMPDPVELAPLFVE